MRPAPLNHQQPWDRVLLLPHVADEGMRPAGSHTGVQSGAGTLTGQCGSAFLMADDLPDCTSWLSLICAELDDKTEQNNTDMLVFTYWYWESRNKTVLIQNSWFQ